MTNEQFYRTGLFNVYYVTVLAHLPMSVHWNV